MAFGRGRWSALARGRGGKGPRQVVAESQPRRLKRDGRGASVVAQPMWSALRPARGPERGRRGLCVEVGCNGNGFGPNCGPLSLAAGLYPLSMAWADLVSRFGPVRLLSMAWAGLVSRFRPLTHASPRRLKNSKWRCSPLSASRPHHRNFSKNPPTKSQPGPGNPCLHSGDHTSPPHLPVRRRHGSGLPHIRGRLRGQRPPLPRRLLARAASASSRSQVRSSPSSRRT